MTDYAEAFSMFAGLDRVLCDGVTAVATPV